MLLQVDNQRMGNFLRGDDTGFMEVRMQARSCACTLLVLWGRRSVCLGCGCTGHLNDSSAYTVQLYTRPALRGGWSAAADGAGGQVRHAAGSVPQLYNDCVAQQRHRRLADFDDHLDDLTQ